LFFMVAWLRNENNIRERIKQVNSGPLSPEFGQLLLETLVHVQFRLVDC